MEPGGIPHLPLVLQRIAARCGEDVMLAVAQRFGGRRLIIPARAMSPEHQLARVFGLRVAQLIASTMEPGPQMIPRARGVINRAMAQRLRRSGLSHSQIAATLDIDLRSAQRYAAGAVPDTEACGHQAAPEPPAICPVCHRRHRRRAQPAPPAPLPLFDWEPS